MNKNFLQHKEKIVSFYREHKRMPGYNEMLDLLGFKSKNAVFKLINRLVDEGVLNKDSQGRLSPKKLFGEIPLLGLVEAGMPSAAEADLLDTISLDEYLIPHKDATYLLEVKGDSMIDAGIHEGDLVVVERRGSPREGDIVIAEVDGGWTMKYYRHDKSGKLYLQPANKDYKDIYPTYDLKIAAIVKGVVRKY